VHGEPDGYLITVPTRPLFVIAVEPTGHAHILGSIPRHTVIAALRQIADGMERGEGDMVIPGGGRG
jgi:hypothetical protein